LQDDDFILTSNRDESPLRKTFLPKKYIEDEVEVIYPKDEKAGGTWIGQSAKKRVVCLLNGGFKNHQRKQSYRMSRGVVVKKILSVETALTFINQFDFNEIEPFTLVLISWEDGLKAYELVWDGDEKYFNKLEDVPKIWSSSTLYNNDQKELRKKWFEEWLESTERRDIESIKKFHLNDKLGEPEFSIKMKRDMVQTVSVTSILKEGSNINMDYELVD
jgi:uncharacterized protein with NRDE domain